jgi:hypothetical protein
MRIVLHRPILKIHPDNENIFSHFWGIIFSKETTIFYLLPRSAVLIRMVKTSLPWRQTPPFVFAGSPSAWAALHLPRQSRLSSGGDGRQRHPLARKHCSKGTMKRVGPLADAHLRRPKM